MATLKRPADPATAVTVALARGLMDGFGVDDIAVRSGLRAADLRAEMVRFSGDGRLGWCLREARKRWRAVLDREIYE